MKKSKFIINNLGKSKVIPALAMLTMLNTHGMSFNENKPEISIQRCHETVSYETAAKQFSSQDSFNTLKSLLKSELKNMDERKLSQAQVDEEIALYTTKINTNILDLAELYRAMENHTIDQHGGDLDKIYQIADRTAIKVDAQHYLHDLLTRLASMRIGMNHDLNSDNTHLKNKTHTKSSIIDETNFYLYAFKEDINTFIFLGNDNNTELMNHEITSRINFNLNDIKYFVAQKNFTENDYNNLLAIINETAHILPKNIFGNNKEICKSLFAVIASLYSFNHTLTNLSELGYNLNGLVEQNQQNIHTRELAY